MKILFLTIIFFSQFLWSSDIALPADFEGKYALFRALRVQPARPPEKTIEMIILHTELMRDYLKSYVIFLEDTSIPPRERLSVYADARHLPLFSHRGDSVVGELHFYQVNQRKLLSILEELCKSFSVGHDHEVLFNFYAAQKLCEINEVEFIFPTRHDHYNLNAVSPSDIFQRMLHALTHSVDPGIENFYSYMIVHKSLTREAIRSSRALSLAHVQVEFNATPMFKSAQLLIKAAQSLMPTLTDPFQTNEVRILIKELEAYVNSRKAYDKLHIHKNNFIPIVDIYLDLGRLSEALYSHLPGLPDAVERIRASLAPSG